MIAVIICSIVMVLTIAFFIVFKIYESKKDTSECEDYYTMPASTDDFLLKNPLPENDEEKPLTTMRAGSAYSKIENRMGSMTTSMASSFSGVSNPEDFEGGEGPPRRGMIDLSDYGRDPHCSPYGDYEDAPSLADQIQNLPPLLQSMIFTNLLNKRD